MGSFHAPRPVVGLCLVVAASLAAGCTHSPSADAPEAEESMESVTLASGSLELFMEHPYLVQGEGAKFNVHLTVLKDGSPIRGGKLTVTGTGPTGKAVTVVQDAPKRAGIYGPTVAFPEAGKNEMVLALESEQATDTIRVPVTVYADTGEAAHAAETAAGEEEEGAITFLKEQAWKIGVVHEPAQRRRLVERLVVPGKITPAAGSKVVVAPPMAGRLLPPEGTPFPRVGDEVKSGQVVAIVQTLQADLGEKLREAEVEIRRAKIDLDHERVLYERAKSLSASDAISKKQFEEAERRFRLAEATYQGKLEAKKVYEETRQSAPNSRAKSPGGSSSGAQALPASLLVLRSPISGTVTEAAVTEGEYVDVDHKIFTVIDLSRVWVEARVSEYDLARVEKAPGASLTLAAYPGRRIDILGEGRGRLINFGSVVDEATRTLAVRYEVANPERTLRVGMFADVAVETTRAEEVLSIPESAVVDEDGRPTAYVLLDGEHFQKRDLTLGVRDSGFVQVIDGVKEGERVVSKGGYAIRLASVSSVIPAHGHTH